MRGWHQRGRTLCLERKSRLFSWTPGMEVVDNASDENNENTRRKATVVPIKIEYV
jgi:hypothetical protein